MCYDIWPGPVVEPKQTGVGMDPILTGFRPRGQNSILEYIQDAMSRGVIHVGQGVEIHEYKDPWMVKITGSEGSHLLSSEDLVRIIGV